MSEQQNMSFKEWFGEHYLALFLIGIFFAYGVLFVSQWNNITEFFTSVKNTIKENAEFDREQRGILRWTDDCDELRRAINTQLGGGANPDSWFPNPDDSATKIATQRYEILGCKP